MEGRGGASFSKSCRCAGSFQQNGHPSLEASGPGAALSLSRGFSCKLGCVTCHLGSLIRRSAAVHVLASPSFPTSAGSQSAGSALPAFAARMEGLRGSCTLRFLFSIHVWLLLLRALLGLV